MVTCTSRFDIGLSWAEESLIEKFYPYSPEEFTFAFYSYCGLQVSGLRETVDLHLPIPTCLSPEWRRPAAAYTPSIGDGPCPWPYGPRSGSAPAADTLLLRLPSIPNSQPLFVLNRSFMPKCPPEGLMEFSNRKIVQTDFIINSIGIWLCNGIHLRWWRSNKILVQV